LRVRSFSILLLLLFNIPVTSPAQTRPAPKPDADRMGMTCAQILAMISTDWVTHFNEKLRKETGDGEKKSSEGAVRALAVYGKCYDARTDRLAAALGKSGKGPLMGARGNFRDFERALSDFSAKALAASGPPVDEAKIASASLYSKQFRYKFYRSYETRQFHAEPTPEDVEALGLAKNRFGELLSALPEDRMRGVHAAFGPIFEKNKLAEEWRLEIYRYAISLLEPPSATPFSPPPF
jgi:hypothetical protein